MKTRYQIVVTDWRGSALPVKDIWEKNGIQFFSVLGAAAGPPRVVRDCDRIKYYRVKV